MNDQPTHKITIEPVDNGYIVTIGSAPSPRDPLPHDRGHRLIAKDKDEVLQHILMLCFPSRRGEMPDLAELRRGMGWD